MIKEFKDLASMSMEALFRKLIGYEHELIQKSQVEDTKKKRKGIALKVSFSKEDWKESSSDDEDVENTYVYFLFGFMFLIVIVWILNDLWREPIQFILLVLLSIYALTVKTLKL